MIHHIEKPRAKVAILIDGENLGAKFAGQLVTQAEKIGSLMIKRVYGNVTVLNGWNDVPGFRVVHSGTGKNAADILLAIEAVDLSYSDQIGTFVLASSDGDFGHLALRLREAGFDVIGMGEVKAGERFRKACTAFHELKQPACESNRPAPEHLDTQIHKVIDGGEGRRNLQIARLGQTMYRQHDVRISSLPEKNWRAYLTSKPDLYRCDDRGKNARVHLRD